MRIILADHRQLVRDGLRYLIESSGYDLVGHATSIEEVKEAVSLHRPQAVVLGLVGDPAGQVDLAQTLVRQAPGLGVLVIAATPVPEYRVQILAQRSVLVLSPRVGFDDLRDALDKLAAGGTELIADGNDAATEAGITGDGPRGLTERETQILRMLAEGLRMKQIARELNLSTKTVETHRWNLSNKLGISNIAQLTRYAVRIGLTDLSYQTV